MTFSREQWKNKKNRPARYLLKEVHLKEGRTKNTSWESLARIGKKKFPSPGMKKTAGNSSKWVPELRICQMTMLKDGLNSSSFSGAVNKSAGNKGNDPVVSRKGTGVPLRRRMSGGGVGPLRRGHKQRLGGASFRLR